MEFQIIYLFVFKKRQNGWTELAQNDLVEIVRKSFDIISFEWNKTAQI